MNWLRTYGRHAGIISVLVLCVVVMMTGCFGSFKKKHTDQPVIFDPLNNGKSVGEVNNGKFTDQGWMPEGSGSITYKMPVMSQGLISFDVDGLNREYGDDIFLTMYEPTELGEYSDPYVLWNPYRVALSFMKYDTAPESPFKLLWTIKQFPTVVNPLDRFVEGLPDNAEGYLETKTSKNMPIYLGETHHIKLIWKLGKAKLFVNDQLLIEHDYAPLIFSPKKLRIVLGNSPGKENLNMPGLTFSNVTITYPEL